MVSLALALCVVSGVAFALDSAVWRARPARPTRQVTAGRIAKSHAAHARLAQSILYCGRIVAVLLFLAAAAAQADNARTRRTFRAMLLLLLLARRLRSRSRIHTTGLEKREKEEEKS